MVRQAISDETGRSLGVLVFVLLLLLLAFFLVVVVLLPVLLVLLILLLLALLLLPASLISFRLFGFLSICLL